MNFYIKKLCVLKQLSSGFAADGKKVSALVTAETYAGKLTVNLSLINFAPLSDGRYRAVLADGHGTAEMFDITGQNGCTLKRESALDIEDGFACLIAFAAGGAKPVAFGKCGERVYDVKKLCAMIGEEEKPASARTKEAGSGTQRSAPPEYDDEVVASENYFEYPDADAENLKIREEGDADTRQKTGSPGKTAKDGAGTGTDENAQSLFRRAGAEDLREDERACYYEKVKKELSSLFAKYPREEPLCRLLPDSEWVRIAFGKGKYYVVGLIREEKRPKYICYGVPAEKRGEPPSALKGWCSFLPASLFDTDGKGYWMMYQDAETGHSVKIHAT